MKVKYIFLFIASLTLCKSAFPQAIIEPVSKPVYNFLERMNNKGIIENLPVMKPYTRNDIIEYLLEINDQKISLSDIESEELEWFEREYFVEDISALTFSESFLNDQQRLRFFFYSDSSAEGFRFYFTPLIFYNINANSKNTLKNSFWGFYSYGSVSNLGFRIDFTENTISGNNILRNDYYSDEQGRIISGSKDKQVQFSHTNGSLTYQNSFLTVGAIKENINFGEGARSQLILSDKAPSFPAVYLKIDPVDWIQFYFLHGWLNSSVIDSSRNYATDFNIRIVEQEKYFVLHALQINPLQNLSITLGETIIYSDKNIYFGYFIPFLFYRSVDHSFTHGGADSGNNGSFFGSLNYRVIDNLSLYSSIYIDELALSKLLKGEIDRNQFGYTVGLNSSVGIDNLFLKLEYTKILPWVYSNWIPSQTYTNSKFLLGHYIGQNADQVFAGADYRFSRAFKLTAWAEYTRRGGTSAVRNQYELPGEPFLYGLRRNDFRSGVNLNYQFMHDLSADMGYIYSNVTDEDKTRTPDWQIGANNSFNFSLRYGF